MTTLSEREAFLRRALHAAADEIDPGADGLERIQRRLRRPRPYAVAWVEAIWTDILLRLPGGFQPAFERVIGVTRLAWERFGPTSRTGSGRAARTLSWLRPLAALGVTVSIVAAGAYVAISAQQAIFPSSANSPRSGGVSTGAGGGGRNGLGTASSQSQSPVSSSGVSSAAAKPRDCKSSPPAATPSSSVGQIQESSTPTTSPSQSGSVSPSPTTSGSSSLNPSGATTNAAGSSVGSLTAPASTPPPTSGATQTAASSKAPHAKASASPCAKKKTTTTRNPVVKVRPDGQVSPEAASYARLEEAG